MRRKYFIVPGRISISGAISHLGCLQPNSDARAPFGTAFGSNHAAMFFHDLFHNGQTQPAAPGFRGNIGFKYIVEHPGGKTGAVVINNKLDIALS